MYIAIYDINLFGKPHGYNCNVSTKGGIQTNCIPEKLCTQFVHKPLIYKCAGNIERIGSLYSRPCIAFARDIEFVWYSKNCLAIVYPLLPTSSYYIKLKSHLSVHPSALFWQSVSRPWLHESISDLLDMIAMSSGMTKFIFKSF